MGGGDGAKMLLRTFMINYDLSNEILGSKIAGWGEIVRHIYNLVQETDQNTLKNLKLDSE